MTRAEKLALLAGPRDRAALTGLEIGARDAPLLTPAEGSVLFADYADSATLRANTAGTHIDPDALVPVDIVLGEKLPHEVMRAPVDYAVASHVAEHVPDLLGWLASIAQILSDGGTLGLAVPDRRLTFDLCRGESTIAEAVEAYVLELRRPSVRQIFDSAWQAVDIGVAEAWQRALPAATAEAAREMRLSPAFDLVRRVHAGRLYNDAHCWVFTPASFLTLARQAAKIGLFPFTIDAFLPTPPGGYEFLVRLRKADPAGAAIAASITSALAAVHASPGEAMLQSAPRPGTDDTGTAAVQARLDAILASTSWRVTAPLRRLAAWRGGLRK